MKRLIACASVICSIVSLTASAAEPASGVKVLLTKPLQGIAGQEATVLTVDIPPGAASPPHRHNANTFVYVLEGTVVMQVQGGPEVTLTAGETFYESPTDIHSVSRNASKTESAKLLVVMTKPVGAPITVPVEKAVTSSQR